MRGFNKGAYFGMITFLLISFARAQPYELTLASGTKLSGLDIVSFKDTTLVVKQVSWTMANNTYDVPVRQIAAIKINGRDGGNPIEIYATDFSIFRSVIMGGITGIIGMYVGAGIGYLVGEYIIGDELIAPVFGGGGIGLVLTTPVGLVYFAKHKIGRRPATYDLASLPLYEKIEQLERILSNE